jgi:hypothetical protein
VDDTGTSRVSHGARGLLAWVAILGLAALVGWLLAERNSRQWFVEPDGGLLVVKRGILFPVGKQTFKTNDPLLADAYAPLVPPPGAALPDERQFDDRSGLDQALFEILAGWAKADVSSAEPARLERGLGYLSRAEKLAGISAAQRDALQALRAESAYYEGQRLLARGAEALRLAAEKLRVAATSASARGADAQALLREVDPAVEAALQAVRAGGAAAPRPAQPEPAPAPAPAAPEAPPAGH